MAQTIVVRATWDPEASVWVAESDDLPLVTEAPTIAALQAKLPGIIQDLIEVEDGEEVDLPVELVWHAHEVVRVRSRAACTLFRTPARWVNGLFRHFFERNQRFGQGLTAINDERLPGNIPGLIGCEEQYRVSDLFNRP